MLHLVLAFRAKSSATIVMNLLGHPNFSMILHKPSLLTVKRLGQVDEGHVEVAVLLLAFFLELAGCEDHICCFTFSAKTALAFWKQAGFKV